jgi:hypothetical protein
LKARVGAAERGDVPGPGDYRAAHAHLYKDCVTRPKKRYWTYQTCVAIMALRGNAGKEKRAWIRRR